MKLALLSLCLVLALGCEPSDDEAATGDGVPGIDVSSQLDATDATGETTSPLPGGVLEARTEAFSTGLALVVEDGGSVIAMGPMTDPDLGYGPSLGLARIATDGRVSDVWRIDTGTSTYAYDVVSHPSGGILAVGASYPVSAYVAWAAHLDLTGPGSVLWQESYGDGSWQNNEFRAVVPSGDGFAAYGYGDPSAGAQLPMWATLGLDGGMGAPAFSWAEEPEMTGSFSDVARSGSDTIAVGYRASYVQGVGYERSSMASPGEVGGDSPIHLSSLGAGLTGVAFIEGDVVVLGETPSTDGGPEGPSVLIARLKRDGLEEVWSMTLEHRRNDLPIGIEVIPGGPIVVASNAFEDGELALLSLIDGDGTLLEEKKFMHRGAQAMRVVNTTEVVLAGFAYADPAVEDDTRPSGWVARVPLD